MRKELKLNEKLIVAYEDMEDYIDAEALTSIDHGNLVGEASQLPTETTRVGIYVAEAEKRVADAKLELAVWESGFKRGLRKEASKNAGLCKVDGVEFKLTEKALESAHHSSDKWIELKNNLAKASQGVTVIEAIKWGLNAKGSMLKNFLQATPMDEHGNVEHTRKGI